MSSVIFAALLIVIALPVVAYFHSKYFVHYQKGIARLGSQKILNYYLAILFASAALSVGGDLIASQKGVWAVFGTIISVTGTTVTALSIAVVIYGVSNRKKESHDRKTTKK